MFKKILIANRGEIACRVIRTAQALGIRCVAVYSDADINALHVRLADEAYRIGPAQVSDSYLRGATIIAAALDSGAEAIHPGYGFLSESPEFVEACVAAGLVFIGPSAAAIRAMGLKDAAKQLMVEAGVAVVPGYHGEEQQADFLAEQALKIGYPVLIKARAGGGGKGMRRVDQAADFMAGLDAARREGEAAFGDGHVLIEKFISSPRHIEVQVFGDQHGNTVHLFERDCSLQRRHQKVIEEAPAPGMTTAMREAMGMAAVRAAEAVNYAGAGTVEFIVDASDGLQPDRFYFMEMNTRLQVEHPVTEMITGLDLVAWQLQVAAGELLPLKQEQLAINGHAFEARIYAEDADKGFVPAIGALSHLYLPQDQVRIDTGVVSSDQITPFYDPMIAKLTVHGPDRVSALNKLSRALEQSRVAGCTTNITFLARLAGHKAFRQGDVDTGLIERDLDQLISSAGLTPEAQRLTLALAALMQAGMLSIGSAAAATAVDPWDTLPGWSHWQDSVCYVDLLADEQAHTLEIMVPEKNIFHINNNPANNEQTLRLQLLDCIPEQGAVRVRANVDGKLCNAHVVAETTGPVTTAITVFYAGRTTRLTVPDYLTSQDESGQAANQLIAPMPGQVKIIHTSVGATVDEGAALMVMEAMKMELTLNAPRDGVIAELTVEAGDQVTEGTVLLTLKEQA